MNAAVDYIEENLAGEIDFSKAAEKAICSTYHFQRVFFAIMGLTPVDYARRRRLTLAAIELSSGKEKIIDMAMKYGYDSPNAFTRAFRQLHGVTPQAAREPGVKLTAYPRISFHIELKGENDMDYKIIKKPAFKIAGWVRRFTTDVEQNMIKIGEWCIEFMNSTEHQELLALVRNQPGGVTGGGMLGICLKIGQEEEWSYSLAVEWPKDTSSSPFEVVQIPAATWAVFETTLDDISKCWRQVFSEWFPSTSYEHSGAPELEVYPPGNDLNGSSKIYIWVPIVKKK
jgi:AraC family transcriptional regulator